MSWHDQGEARQAVQIIPKWTEIDVDEALELLGPNFDNSVVRAYAVDRLRKADDEVSRPTLLHRTTPALTLLMIGTSSVSVATGSSLEIREDPTGLRGRCRPGLVSRSISHLQGDQKLEVGKFLSLVLDRRVRRIKPRTRSGVP